jgi:hypothetical protein
MYPRLLVVRKMDMRDRNKTECIMTLRERNLRIHRKTVDNVEDFREREKDVRHMKKRSNS